MTTDTTTAICLNDFEEGSHSRLLGRLQTHFGDVVSPDDITAVPDDTGRLNHFVVFLPHEAANQQPYKPPFVINQQFRVEYFDMNGQPLNSFPQASL